MWSNIPPEILTKIFKFLSPLDAFPAGITCRRWNFQGFQSSSFWRSTKFQILGQNPREKSYEVWMNFYGNLIENLTFQLDQFSTANREFCLKLMRILIGIENFRIFSLQIEFCGENPLFYAGQEFLQILIEFFGLESTKIWLKFLDISKLHILLDNSLIDSLISCKNLQFLDIQNKNLVTKISPEVFENLVRNCKKLRDLRLFHSCLSNEVLLSFNSGKLEHLSISCRRMDKFFQNDLSDVVWEALVQANPRLEVTLKFDHTCPLWKVREVMKPSIPVVNLFLETYTMIYEELDIASDSYGRKLKKIVIQSQQSEELESALIQTAERCPNLTSLHVMCRLDEAAIHRIHELLPDLKEFTLKSEMEAYPWVNDAVLDEINSHWK